MKYKDIIKVNRLNETFRDLVSQKEMVERIQEDSGLGVTIQGKYQDLEFVNAARPHVVAELVRLCEKVKNEMIRLGVEFDEPGREFLDKLRRDLQDPLEIVKKLLERAKIPFVSIDNSVINMVGSDGGVFNIPAQQTAVLDKLEDVPQYFQNIQAAMVFLYQVDSPSYHDVDGNFKIRFSYLNKRFVQ